MAGARMPWRTWAFTTLVDRGLRGSIVSATPADIERSRAFVYPSGPGLDRLFGRGREPVGIAFGTAQARDGYSIPLRMYRPRGAAEHRDDLPVILYLHGGGWVWGNVVNYDALCRFVAHEVQAVVVSVDYRLAPEHPAPQAAHDAIDATLWVAGHDSALRADTTTLAVCGDSAGGNLAAVVAQDFRDRGLDCIRHQALIYPATDMTMQSPSLVEHAVAPILSRAAVDRFADHYEPRQERRADPVVSPLFGGLSGLPPALIQTADLDPIRDDGLRYAVALRAAGVQVRGTNYLGVPHGFMSFPGATTAGAQARAELVGELRAHLA